MSYRHVLYSPIDSHVSNKASEMNDKDHECFDPTCLDNILTSCAGAGDIFLSSFPASTTDTETQQFYIVATALAHAVQRVGFKQLNHTIWFVR